MPALSELGIISECISSCKGLRLEGYALELSISYLKKLSVYLSATGYSPSIWSIYIFLLLSKLIFFGKVGKEALLTSISQSNWLDNGCKIETSSSNRNKQIGKGWIALEGCCIDSQFSWMLHLKNIWHLQCCERGQAVQKKPSCLLASKKPIHFVTMVKYAE